MKCIVWELLMDILNFATIQTLIGALECRFIKYSSNAVFGLNFMIYIIAQANPSILSSTKLIVRVETLPIKNISL